MFNRYSFIQEAIFTKKLVPTKAILNKFNRIVKQMDKTKENSPKWIELSNKLDRILLVYKIA